MTIFQEDSYFEETFSGISYTNEKIVEKEFEKCVFKKCTFIECTFEHCKFIDCTCEECSMSAITPYSSTFMNCVFKNSKVLAFDWTKAKTVHELSFENCDISYSNFSFLKLHNFRLVESNAKEVNFTQTDLTEGTFTNTDFSGAIFSGTNLTKADFRKAYNYGIDFNFNTLKKAKFSLPETASLLKSLDIILDETPSSR